jgi:Protein of unknown function (DUF2846)
MGTYRAVIAALIMVVLAAGATVSTTTAEPQSKQRDARPSTATLSQSKPRDARLARLYFIWPRSWMFKSGKLDIKLNGAVVAKVGPDSYVFIDHKPGTYTLRVEPPFDFTYFEADVKIAAGGTYYYSVNSRGAAVPLIGGGFVTMNPTPTTGTSLEPKSGAMATYQLRVMDAAAAAAAMKDLDAR